MEALQTPNATKSTDVIVPSLPPENMWKQKLKAHYHPPVESPTKSKAKKATLVKERETVQLLTATKATSSEIVVPPLPQQNIWKQKLMAHLSPTVKSQTIFKAKKATVVNEEETVHLPTIRTHWQQDIPIPELPNQHLPPLPMLEIPPPPSLELPPLPDLSNLHIKIEELRTKNEVGVVNASRPTTKLPSPDVYTGGSPMVLGHQFPLPYKFISRETYDVLYSNIDKSPIVIRWVLTPDGMEWDRKQNLKRSSRFVKAKEVDDLYQASVQGMKKAGFNIGHWVPSADMGHNTGTNNLINCSIQDANLNQTIELYIETFTRKLAQNSDYTIVMKGTMHRLKQGVNGNKYIHIDVHGRENVHIPQCFWKAAVCFKGNICTMLNYWIYENVKPPFNATIENYQPKTMHGIWEGSGMPVFREFCDEALIVNGKLRL